MCDAENDIPNVGEIVFVDTNIWIFQTYPAATLGIDRWRQKQIDVYNLFLGRAKRVGATLAIFPTVLLEMANVIERYEFEIACRQNGVEPRTSGHELKTYRQSDSFRKTVASAVTAAWAEASSRAKCFEPFDSTDCFAAGLEAEASAIGIWDALHLQLARKHGFSCILSDDIDFVDPRFNITLLTKNAKALKKAADLSILARRQRT